MWWTERAAFLRSPAAVIKIRKALRRGMVDSESRPDIRPDRLSSRAHAIFRATGRSPGRTAFQNETRRGRMVSPHSSSKSLFDELVDGRASSPATSTPPVLLESYGFRPQKLKRNDFCSGKWDVSTQKSSRPRRTRRRGRLKYERASALSCSSRGFSTVCEEAACLSADCRIRCAESSVLSGETACTSLPDFSGRRTERTQTVRFPALLRQ